MTDNERNFIIELEALSRKYSLCVSTNLWYPDKEELVPEAGYVYLNGNLFWTSPENPWWKKGEGDDQHYEGRVIGKEAND